MDHAADAIITVLEMQEAVAGFNKSLKERGLPEISMRAGIGTEAAMFCRMWLLALSCAASTLVRSIAWKGV